MAENRRRRFFIDKPLQIRYMAAVVAPLLVINLVALLGFYFGIWGKVLDAFSNEQLRNEMVTASRMIEYEEARHPEPSALRDLTSLSLFKQTEKLSQRQREVFKGILNETNRSLLWKFAMLLLLIAWGTIFISHRIAGPLYRFSKALDAVERGDYRARVRLRKGDEGHPVAREFNEALERTDLLLSGLKKASQDTDPGRAVRDIQEKLSKVQTSADA
ncbi:MAG: hypothetical protein KTQ49_07000 [Candidatus Omnitrophica bacterium]|nr:hypothetical protein [Candidatus Omnitrophota bacterium]